jgi:lipid-A-disaccharide synthase
MLTVLPFEPAFFERFAIPSTYVGHPVLESGADRGDGDAFRHRHGLAPEAPLISVLPGSRQTEIARLLPVFRGALDRLAARHAGLTAVVSAPDSLREAVAAATRGWAVPTIVVSDDAEKYDAFAASRAAITKSGTVTLELALARLPMVVCYKVSPSTAFLARRLIRVDHAALVNLIAERAVVPELLQGACTAEEIAEKTDPLMRESPARMTQEAAFREIVRRLGEASPTPSERAAEVVLRLARQGRAPSAGPLEARTG